VDSSHALQRYGQNSASAADGVGPFGGTSFGLLAFGSFGLPLCVYFPLISCLLSRFYLSMNGRLHPFRMERRMR
jgi:hypothetical protein